MYDALDKGEVNMVVVPNIIFLRKILAEPGKLRFPFS